MMPTAAARGVVLDHPSRAAHHPGRAGWTLVMPRPTPILGGRFLLPSVEPPWAKVPTSLTREPGITLGDVQVFVHIDYEAGKRGWWRGTQREIVTATGISERTVRSAITKLVDLGYIETQRLGIEHGTMLKYWVLSRAQPIEEPDGESPEPPAIDRRSVGEHLPLGRRAFAGATTSDQDLSTDQRDQEPLSLSQSELARHLRRRVMDDVFGARTGSLPPGWGEDVIRDGATREDIDGAITTTLGRTAGALYGPRGAAFVLGCIRNAIEERREGRGVDTRTGGGRTGANGSARQAHGGGVRAGDRRRDAAGGVDPRYDYSKPIPVARRHEEADGVPPTG